jgi:hypothetical protein
MLAAEKASILVRASAGTSVANKTILTPCLNWPHGCKAVFTGREMNRGKYAAHVRECPKRKKEKK